MSDSFDDIIDEAKDFAEDFWELLTKQKSLQSTKKKITCIAGTAIVVRPAYLFAERIDNLLRVVFGISILLSALTATFLGFSTLSQLLNFLIYSLIGRLGMVIIGSSYVIVASWKLMNLHLGKSSR